MRLQSGFACDSGARPHWSSHNSLAPLDSTSLVSPEAKPFPGFAKEQLPARLRDRDRRRASARTIGRHRDLPGARNAGVGRAKHADNSAIST